jgi:hypothetical protein
MNEDEAVAGPRFWDDGVRCHEHAADFCRDSPQTAARHLEGETPADAERRYRQQAERCRRVAAAMRGGTP